MIRSSSSREVTSPSPIAWRMVSMYRAKSWKTGAICDRTRSGSQPARSTPSHSTTTASGGSRPQSNFASVDLPEPFAPTTAMIWPRRSSKLTEPSASRIAARVPVAEIPHRRAPAVDVGGTPTGRRSRMTGSVARNFSKSRRNVTPWCTPPKALPGGLEASAELLESDDGDGSVADGDRAVAGEDHRDRQRRDQHRGGDEGADGREREALAHELVQTA